MTKAKARAWQSIPDLTLQECGGLEAVMDVAMDNGVSITDDVPAGMMLDFGRRADGKVADLFAASAHKPATAITTDEINAITGDGEGIEFWFVEYDLIVS